MEQAIRLASQAASIMVSRQGTADVIPDLKDIQDRVWRFLKPDFLGRIFGKQVDRGRSRMRRPWGRSAQPLLRVAAL